MIKIRSQSILELNWTAQIESSLFKMRCNDHGGIFRLKSFSPIYKLEVSICGDV